jgi:hypothetical protein
VVAPSPLRATSSASSEQTSASARAKAAASGRGALREDSATTVSEVLVSLSMVMQLNEPSQAALSAARSSSRGTSRSVRR